MACTKDKITNHKTKTTRALAFFAIFLSFSLISCSNDSKSTNSSDDESEKTTNITVSGLAQIAPFEKNATVTVYELDKNFQQTGRNYKTEIENDQGEFSIKLKDLESKYALLKADGYYRSPVTGEKANKKATLYALADLENDSEININILTHLSHKRAIYLATEKNKPIAKAKKKAEAEVLKSFGIEEDFDEAKNLNIIGNDNQSIALLAMSIMMQSGVDETKLKERLTNYATDIEEDGVWNDDETIAQIADWAYKVYYHSAFGAIKENVKKWNSSAVFATFEKYTNAFWHSHYGLGTCTDDRKNEVRRNELFFSDFEKKYFICRPGGKWKEASDQQVEKFFNIDENATDGMVRNIKHESDPNTTKCEVYEDGEWRIGNDNDCNYGIGGCTKKREGLSKIILDYQYTCKNQEWIRTYISTNIKYNDSSFTQPIRFDLDTIGWKDTTDGTIRKGNFSDVVYIFDKDVWRIANVPEASLGKCTKENQDSAGYAEYRDGQTNLNPLYSICNYNNQLYDRYDNCPNSHYQSGYYKCSHIITEDSKDTIYAWSAVNHKCVLDKYDLKGEKLIRWKDGKEGETRWGLFWKEYTEKDSTYKSYDDICRQNCYQFTNGEWTQTSITECMGLGTCDDKLIGTIKEGPSVKSEKKCYIEHNDSHEYGFNHCYDFLVKVDSLKKTNYICQHSHKYEKIDCETKKYIYDYCEYTHYSVIGDWGIATDFSIEMSKLKCTQDGALVSIKADSLNQYVCDKNEFRQASDEEKIIGLGCTDYTRGKKFIPDGLKSYFICSYGIRNGIEYDMDKTKKENLWTLVPSENQDTMTDPRDSTVYKTINIGSTTWMMENLNYADSANYTSMLKRNKCKDDNPDSCKKYGRLYTWSAAIDSVYWASKGKTCGNTKENDTTCGLPEVVQGICPNGWHLPSYKDWEDLDSWMYHFATIDNYRKDNFIPIEEEHHDFLTSSESTKSLTYSASSHQYDYNVYEAFFDIEPHFDEPEDTQYSVRCVKDD